MTFDLIMIIVFYIGLNETSKKYMYFPFKVSHGLSLDLDPCQKKFFLHQNSYFFLRNNPEGCTFRYAILLKIRTTLIHINISVSTIFVLTDWMKK